MKALVFEKPEQPVVIDVPMPTLRDSEVLIRTAAIGISIEVVSGRI